MKEYFSENKPDLIPQLYHTTLSIYCSQKFRWKFPLILAPVYLKTMEHGRFSSSFEIEIYGFENGHADDPIYEGEKVMAERYEEIMEYLNNF